MIGTCIIKEIHKEELKMELVGAVGNPQDEFYLYVVDLTFVKNNQEQRATRYFPKEDWENKIKPNMKFVG